MSSIVITGARGRIADAISSTIERKCGNIIKLSRTLGNGCLSHDDAFDADIFKHASVILHTAWSTVPATSQSHPGIEWKNDLPFLAKIFNSLKDCGKNKPLFILFSSGGTVYGNALGRASLETDNTCPSGWYGRGKVAAESLSRDFASDFELPLLILRISNPYGFASRLNRPQGLISAAINSAMLGIPLKVWGDGSALKDYLYWTDLADALANAINARTTGVFNIGYGSSIKVSDVLKIVEQTTKKKLILDYTPAPTWDVTDSRINCDAFGAATGWRPSIDLENGVRLSVDAQMDP